MSVIALTKPTIVFVINSVLILLIWTPKKLHKSSISFLSMILLKALPTSVIWSVVTPFSSLVSFFGICCKFWLLYTSWLYPNYVLILKCSSHFIEHLLNCLKFGSTTCQIQILIIYLQQLKKGNFGWLGKKLINTSFTILSKKLNSSFICKIELMKLVHFRFYVKILAVSFGCEFISMQIPSQYVSTLSMKISSILSNKDWERFEVLFRLKQCGSSIMMFSSELIMFELSSVLTKNGFGVFGCMLVIERSLKVLSSREKRYWSGGQERNHSMLSVVVRSRVVWSDRLVSRFTSPSDLEGTGKTSSLSLM